MSQVFSGIYDANISRRKCSYNKSEKYEKHYEKMVDFDSDFTSSETTQIFNLKADVSLANNKAGFSPHEFKKKKFLTFLGPTISSTCEISNLKETKFDRIFGYIQTVSTMLNESEYDYALRYSDYQVKLLRNQSEIIDTDAGDNQYKPFYSEKCCEFVSAGKISPEGKINLNLILDDQPKLTIELQPDDQIGCLKSHRRYVEFSVYLVMRSKENNGEWKDIVLDKYMWFIYFNWSHENENNPEFDYGFKSCTKTELDPIIFNEDCKYTCNDDTFKYSINLRNGDIKIKTYPISEKIVTDEQKENFRRKIKGAVMKLYYSS